MTHLDILKDIKTKKYHPIYLLYGDEPYFIDMISDFIEENVLTEGEKAFNQVVLYGKDTDFKTVVDEARQFPMMSNYRLIIIKEAQDMKTLTDLLNYVEKPSENAILVICHKYKKLDKRTKFAKTLLAKSVNFESKKLYDNQVAPWINDYLKSKKVIAEPKVADVLAEYLGSDLSKLSNELDKLLINIKENQSITITDVQEHIGISKEFNVFELQNALGEKNFAKANMIIRYFIENPKNNPLIQIVSTLYTFFNKVYITTCYPREDDQALAKKLGLVSTYFVRDYRKAAQNYSRTKLMNVFQALKEADKHSKGVGSRHPSDESVLKDILIACISN